ncbi:MAG: anti-sigma factor, partial [Acidobacteria bacterium]|nr:anti-sigma factor [Acidobacteriota bacterium]
DAVRSAEFEEHLQLCPDCAREFRNQQTMRQSLRASDLYERAPGHLRTRIRAALPREVRQAPVLMPRRFVLEWLAVAAAIILAVVFGARVIPNIGDRQQANLLAQEVVNSHIRSLQPGHLFDVQSTDQHAVKPWFDGKLDFAPPVINLADQEFPLVGGRLDYMSSRSVAALVYQRHKHFINVFVWPDESKSVKLPEIQTIQGYNLVLWRRDGMNFCAVSDLNLTELRQFVQLLER